MGGKGWWSVAIGVVLEVKIGCCVVFRAYQAEGSLQSSWDSQQRLKGSEKR